MQWAAANCAALPTANAGQYATLHCKPPLFVRVSRVSHIDVKVFLHLYYFLFNSKAFLTFFVFFQRVYYYKKVDEQKWNYTE